MKKTSKIIDSIICAACAAVAAGGTAGTVFADDSVIYGTMNIPYADFYAEEGVSGEVDAVASATTTKWKNENLTAGTYSSENADGTGTILGVTYPVAISQDDLTALGENNYSFTELESVPAAYKTVTVSSGKAEFSKVSGDTAAVTGVETSISTETPWGDYVIDMTSINNQNGTSDIGTIYGVMLFTDDGEGYGMRHLENLWRDEIAWSTGFTTEEPHGSTLEYENYVSLMGKTITEIRFITDSGYHSLEASLYVPIKFSGSVSVADNVSGDGSAAITLDGFPADYEKTYSVEGVESTVSDSSIDYKNAMPGSYTLNISDGNGVYADMSADFTLTTDEMPAQFDGTKLVKADGASDSDFENFIKNLSNVNINGTDYAASGRGAVSIIGTDGTIDYTVTTGRGEEQTAIFGGGEYEFTLTSAGYTQTLLFTTNGSSDTSVSASAETAAAASTTESDDVKSNPATGIADNTALVGLTLVSVLALLVSKKRK